MPRPTTRNVSEAPLWIIPGALDLDRAQARPFSASHIDPTGVTVMSALQRVASASVPRTDGEYIVETNTAFTHAPRHNTIRIGPIFRCGKFRRAVFRT